MDIAYFPFLQKDSVIYLHYQNKISMQKKYTFIIILFLFMSNLNAQILKRQSLGINGLSSFIHTNTNYNYFIQQSIGQASVIRTYDVNGHRLRQGFLQPINPSVLNSRFDNKLDAVTFPNPFVNKIKIRFIDPINDILIVRLYDMYGRLILTRKYDFTQNLEVEVGGIATGVYNLRIDSGNKFMETKLIKK